MAVADDSMLIFQVAVGWLTKKDSVDGLPLLLILAQLLWQLVGWLALEGWMGHPTPSSTRTKSKRASTSEKRRFRARGCSALAQNYRNHIPPQTKLEVLRQHSSFWQNRNIYGWSGK